MGFDVTMCGKRGLSVRNIKKGTRMYPIWLPIVQVGSDIENVVEFRPICVAGLVLYDVPSSCQCDRTEVFAPDHCEVRFSAGGPALA